MRSDEGVTVHVGGPRPRSLMALLALHAGRVVPADQLIAGLYGTEPPHGVVNALQAQVSRLRRGLRAAGVTAPIEMHGAGYRLALDPEQVDALRFARLAREGRQALEAGEFIHATALLREALTLWHGPALADVADAPFAAAHATRLTEQRVSVLEDLAEAELRLGRHGALVAELREAVAEHPLRERLRGQLMRALAGVGRQAEALAVFEDARRMLAEELGADPSPELMEAHLAVLRGQARASREPAPTRSGLPARVSSFVGRETELSRVGDLLSSGRLVTLVGPGGVGKTRLALEVAEQAVGHTVAEAWFVDLAVVPSDGTGGGVAEVVASALGLHDTGQLRRGEARLEPEERLITALTDREALLVLDNCEHVVAETARLVQRLLGACRRLRVLATSREALGMTGEMLAPLAPLATPSQQEISGGITPERALEYPAVRLFMERAVAVRPDFRLTEAEVEPVLRICATLDGLPLALELAAARLRSLPLAELEARLSDRFRLLGRGERTAAPRHRTLRAVVEWSWNLLDAREQVLARRLTVFVGGASLSAVMEVCADNGADDAAVAGELVTIDDAAEVIADLVDKSLLEVDAAGRYRMLETVREFCAERLAESGERTRLEAAHAQWCLRLAAEAEPQLRGGGQREWLARLDTEHPNLLAAIRRSTRTAPDQALRMIALLSGYWHLRGLRGEIAPLTREVVRTIGPRVPQELHDEYVLCVLNARTAGDDSPEWREWWDRVVTIMKDRTTPPRYPYLSLLWAVAAGPTDATRERPEAYIGTDLWSQALAHLGKGYMALFAGAAGELVEAEYEAALRGFRAVGDLLGQAEALNAAATLASRRGQHTRSLHLWAEGIAAADKLGSVALAVDMRCHRGDALLRNGDIDGARAEYAWVESVARREGLRDELNAARCGLADVARLTGDGETARGLYELTLRDTTVGFVPGAMLRVRALVGLGRLAEAEGDTEGALAKHREALNAALESGDLEQAAWAVEGLAGVALATGDGERAAFLVGLADALRGGETTPEPDTVRLRSGVRDLLGAYRFTQIRSRGAALPLEAVLAELGVGKPATPHGQAR